MSTISSVKMFSYDFHIHTALSPCGDMDMTPNNIVNMAKLLELDAIVISDHNSIGNAEAAMKVGERIGQCVMPGMEVETAEAVHVLTIYPSLDRAKSVAEAVYDALPDIKNKPELFGYQAFMDEWDNIVGYEDKLLISSTSITLNELMYMVKAVGGIFIPAHVDRHSYSILMNLGFIPEDLAVDGIEFSKNVRSIDEYLSNRPDLKGYKIFRNSDAHYLEDISEPVNFLGLDRIDELFNK